MIVVGTTADADAVPSEVLACFKQEIELKAPNEDERLAIMEYKLEDYEVAPDVDTRALARQTAALNAGDINSLVHLAWIAAVKRSTSSCVSFPQAQQAGISITSEDFRHALSKARAAYSDSIGAPKIPNVSWDDVGGLVSVKQDILDTIQLPLERPEMFGEGLKKRSGESSIVTIDQGAMLMRMLQVYYFTVHQVLVKLSSPKQSPHPSLSTSSPSKVPSY